MKNQQRAQNPMSEYLLKLQLIVSNTEFKNREEASQYETVESKKNGEAYVRAYNKTDMFESYDHDPKWLYRFLLQKDYSEERCAYLIHHPESIPLSIREEILETDREILISNYEEPNKYYVNLMGQPFMGNKTEPADKIITIPTEFYRMYKDEGELQEDQPIHDLPEKYINLFTSSIYYEKTLKENPNVKYLRYLGDKAIPVHVSRPAQDGDILKINTNKLQMYHEIFGNVFVEPEIVHEFTSTYHEVREYVYGTLRGDFSAIYANYNSFIRFLTIYLTIGNALNRYMKKSASLIYMNNVIANDYFMLYGLPSVIMEGKTMIDFLKKFRLLLMDKGTNVVYRVKDLIGYEYTDIYTLVMVKQQQFINGIPIYYTSADGTLQPKQEIVFRRMGTADDNTSYFKFRDSNVTYTVDEITSGDPRWWNTPEVEEMIQNMNYTLSNSKYIQLSTHMSMEDVWWECTIFLRGLLDKRMTTRYTPININYNINGTETLNVFDAVLLLVILMNWQQTDFNGNAFHGNMYIPNYRRNGVMQCVDMLFNGMYNNGKAKPLKYGYPYKVSSFNFDFKNEFTGITEDGTPAWKAYITSKDYLEPDVFLPMLQSILDQYDGNMGELLMVDIKNLYQYLVDKLQQSKTIREFRQVTDVYMKLFLVNPNRQWGNINSTDNDRILCEAWGITTMDLDIFRNFFLGMDDDSDGRIQVSYNGKSIYVNVYDVLSKNVWDLELRIDGTHTQCLFQDPDFQNAFEVAVSEWDCGTFEVAFPNSIITHNKNYRRFIMDKVQLDISGTDEGTKTFEALLFRINPTMYRELMTIKGDGESSIMFMRAIVKALEDYANTSLPALEYNALGRQEYMRILKEVITYFKSYMVEFTKEEFSLIFDGLFDRGGNSNMLRLYDEMVTLRFRLIVTDSVSLYDVSHPVWKLCMKDDLHDFIYDEALFRIKTTYQKIKSLGYPIWFDDGNRITREVPSGMTNTKKIIGNMVKGDDTAYKIIVPIENIEKPFNYVGNVI